MVTNIPPLNMTRSRYFLLVGMRAFHSNYGSRVSAVIVPINAKGEMFSYRQWNGHEVKVRDHVQHHRNVQINLRDGRLAVIWTCQFNFSSVEERKDRIRTARVRVDLPVLVQRPTAQKDG